MITRQRKTSPLHYLWMPALTAAFLGYFGFHAYSGSYGMQALEQYRSDRATLAMQLSYLRRQHAALEARIATVRPDALDPDVVDMEARLALNLMRADEIVISTR